LLTTSNKIEPLKYSNKPYKESQDKPEHFSSFSQRNPKAVKHEKRHRNVMPLTATGLDIYIQTWQYLLATQKVRIPLGKMQGLPSESINQSHTDQAGCLGYDG